MKTIEELIKKLESINTFAYLALATEADDSSGVERIKQICKESGGYNIFQDGIAGHGMPGDIVVTYENEVWGFYFVTAGYLPPFMQGAQE